MSRPVSALRNLGPSMETAFARVGIHSAEALIELGADAAYLRLLESGVRSHFIAYWATVLAIQDRHWTDLGAAEKAELRVRFDALKAAAARRAGIEAELDRLGLPAQPTSSRPANR